MGRPTKLTPETQERIIQAIRLGATYELAANYGGVHYDTMNRWRLRGQKELDRIQRSKRHKMRESERPFVEFYEALKKAEGDAAVTWLARIEQAAREGTWQAAAWKLERRFPQAYGRHVMEVQGGESTRPVPITYITVPANPKAKSSRE